MFLTAEQLVELTKKTYSSAQARQLDIWGIPCLPRIDGTLAVSIAVVEKKLGLDYSDKLTKQVEPNWDELENAEAA